MDAIVLTDDELQRLETRFGPVVRQMGPWNSDGVFGNPNPVVAYKEASLWPHPSVPMNSRSPS
jgi:hypothetical protein